MTGRAARVALAVDPPILADLLRRLLESPEVEVIIHPERLEGRGGEPCDVAIITGSHLPEPEADVVIRLPEDPRGFGIGTVETSEGRQRVAIQSVADLVELIEGFVSA